ncbi:hypothetical protein [Anaplasma phagocytophilum]
MGVFCYGTLVRGTLVVGDVLGDIESRVQLPHDRISASVKYY